ncbi:MAG: hypothetical protein LBH84_02965, partial [Prevotellaceae bacterium]|nr:hypothetical protein [Prevotellaceae bacterium]
MLHNLTIVLTIKITVDRRKNHTFEKVNFLIKYTTNGGKNMDKQPQLNLQFLPENILPREGRLVTLTATAYNSCAMERINEIDLALTTSNTGKKHFKYFTQDT